MDINFTDKLWHRVEDISKKTGLSTNDVISRSIMVYELLFDMYKMQEGTNHSLEVHSKKWVLLDNERHISYGNLKELLGLEKK